MALNPLFGRAIGINVDRNVLADSTKVAKSDAIIYAGRAVALNSSSEVVDFGNDATSGGAGNVRIAGLARANKNQYANETHGQTYGSGSVDMVIIGIVTLKANVFSDAVTGEDIESPTYDESLTYAVGDALYVDQSADASKRGLVTNFTDAGNVNTFIGWVLRAPSATEKSMQLLMK